MHRRIRDLRFMTCTAGLVAARNSTIARCEEGVTLRILHTSTSILHGTKGVTEMYRQITNSAYPIEAVGSSPESLEDLYTDYRERLLRFVMPKVGRDPHVAEDVVQEAFVAALVSLAGFGARSSPYTWLCAIAQHKIADYYRKSLPSNGGVSTTLELDLLIHSEEDDDYPSSVERWFETMETTDMVQNALHELPNVHREVLRLKYFDGLSVAEIGERLGRSPKAIEGLLARARQSLSRMLMEAARS